MCYFLCLCRGRAPSTESLQHFYFFLSFLPLTPSLDSPLLAVSQALDIAQLCYPHPLFLIRTSFHFISSVSGQSLFPVFLITAISFAVFFSSPEDLRLRLSTTVTLFLSLVAVQFVVVTEVLAECPCGRSDCTVWPVPLDSILSCCGIQDGWHAMDEQSSQTKVPCLLSLSLCRFLRPHT